MRRFFCILVLGLSLLLVAHEALALAVPSLCQSALGERATGHLIDEADSFGISFSLPRGFSRQRASEIDSFVDTWSRAEESVVHQVGSISGFDPRRDRSCYLMLSKIKTLVFVRESQEETSVRFGDPLRNDRFHAIAIRGWRQSSLLLLIMESLAVSGQFEKLEISFVSVDNSFFCYRNELNSRLVARVGDVITRNDGRVTAIRQNGVDVVELAPDGMGGYSAITRTIEISNSE